MKRKTRNSLKSSKRTVTDGLYLPDECWESIFKFIIIGGDDIDNNRHYLKSLSLVSKQFLSITNRLRSSLRIWKPTRPLLRRLFKRFPNLNSLDFSCYKGRLDYLLRQVSRYSLNLTSLNVSNRDTIPENGLKDFSKNVTTLTSLTCSHISCLSRSNMTLIADCFPLLEELDLGYPVYCENSYITLLSGVETLLSALFKLRKVNLTKHYYITDQLVFHLFKSCKFLEEVIIFQCPKVTNVGIASALTETLTLRSLSFTNYFEPQEWSMLFDLVKNSPSLSEIGMEYELEKSVETSNTLMDIVVSPQLKSLRLTRNSRLRDETIKIFSSIFPNLQLLDLSNCIGISDEGICQVLRKCCKIRHLNLARCLKVKLLGMNFEILNLEVLNLSHTSIDDETLNVISKSCRGLLQLLLEHCDDVTEKGVKHVEENCSQLREINLRGCFKVHGDVVASLVFSRPSLRKIIAPPCYPFSDIEKELGSYQGCLIC